MADAAMDLAFLDTECLGLDPEAPIWEFAAVRRFAADVAEEGKP